ncbi:diguanylate cyclase [Fusibacter tunisiensis]|uniref:diguanylate cyclase n=1 Tax=Fusibacter tunisiensis TaxID=1008308 RepID=UPI00195A5763
MLAFLVTLNRIRKDFMELALRDQLTGIYNRLSFFEFAEKEVAKCKRTKKPMHLLMFDIDFFKKVNDTFGHAKGDLVLREISGLVQSSIRSYDILGRYGGEEFMVLMPDIDCENAKDVAERIRLEIECHEFEGVGRVTVSIGLAQYTSPESIESLIDRADQALYVAKETGRNRVCTWEHPNNEV